MAHRALCGLATAASAFVLSGCDITKNAVAAPVDGARLVAADADRDNWLTHGRDYAEQRFSPLTQINADTIGTLGLAWSHEFDTNRGQEATPIIADGVLYTTTAWSKVFAFEAVTGKLLWSYDPQVAGAKGYHACCDVVNRGVALWDGKVYFGTIDGRLIALDAKTGVPVWSTQTTDNSRPYTITGAPRVVKGKVLIGNGGAEFGVRGYVSAYDAATGKLAWRFYTTPNPTGAPDGAASDAVLARLGNPTWGANGAWKRSGGGGTVWDAIVYDQELDQVIIGTGNGSPWNRRIRSGDRGDNLFLSSVVALDPATGAYKWHYQQTPGESWDFTATQPIILATLKIGGQDRRVLMQAPKNGYFFVIDRTSGKPVSVTNFVPTNWADGYDPATWRPRERPEARYEENGGNFVAVPSAFGAHNWHPMAYNRQTGLVYIPVQLVPFGYQDDKNFTYGEGRWNLGNVSPSNIGPRNEGGMAALRAASKGELLAWDPVAGKARWRVTHDAPGYGGILTTAGNLVFQGTPDGALVAYRADDGRKVWSFQGQTGIIAPPATFAVKGEQYVAVMAGYGGSAGISSPFANNRDKRPNGQLLVFKLGGKAQLPPYTAPKLAANPPAQTWPAAVEDKGEALFAANCGFCHGPSAYSTGVLPDLRRSAALSDQALWKSVVYDGMLKDRGMIAFNQWLTPEEVEALRAFVAKQARVLKVKEDGVPLAVR